MLFRSPIVGQLLKRMNYLLGFTPAFDMVFNKETCQILLLF
jgi:hypothetical protein